MSPASSTGPPSPVTRRHLFPRHPSTKTGEPGRTNRKRPSRPAGIDPRLPGLGDRSSVIGGGGRSCGAGCEGRPMGLPAAPATRNRRKTTWWRPPLGGDRKRVALRPWREAHKDSPASPMRRRPDPFFPPGHPPSPLFPLRLPRALTRPPRPADPRIQPEAEKAPGAGRWPTDRPAAPHAPEKAAPAGGARARRSRCSESAARQARERAEGPDGRSFPGRSCPTLRERRPVAARGAHASAATGTRSAAGPFHRRPALAPTPAPFKAAGTGREKGGG